MLFLRVLAKYLPYIVELSLVVLGLTILYGTTRDMLADGAGGQPVGQVVLGLLVYIRMVRTHHSIESRHNGEASRLSDDPSL